MIVLILITLLLALPTAIIDLSASAQLSTIPPAFDPFMDRVRAATPPNARVVVADLYTDPRYNMLHRCQYALYPRIALARQVLPADIVGGKLIYTWTDWERIARRRHARYLVLWTLPAQGSAIKDDWQWALPSLPRGRLAAGLIRVREGWGTLIYVPA